MQPPDLNSVAIAICGSRGWSLSGRVGAGGFKETFRASLPQGQDVALKVFRPDASVDRAAREIEALLRCTHPNIGRLHDVSMATVGGVQYLFAVEEFIPGGTLGERLRTRGLLTADETWALGSVLIDVVSHIASHDLVHRDLKPDNVLLRADGVTPVVIDFGIVRNLGDTSLTQSWLMRGPGTPFFASPEQLNNEKAMISWRADQFSLGVLLSLCVFGAHPYQDTNARPDAVIDAVARRASRPAWFVPAAQQRGLPVLIRMTEPWPVQRYRLPRELATAWTAQR